MRLEASGADMDDSVHSVNYRKSLKAAAVRWTGCGIGCLSKIAGLSSWWMTRSHGARFDVIRQAWLSGHRQAISLKRDALPKLFLDKLQGWLAGRWP